MKFLDLLGIEFMKVKRSKIIPLIFIAPLLVVTSGVVNISYMCWLWNPELEQYAYKFILNGYDVIVDNDTQEIITMSRDGWGQYYIDYFKYNNEEELYHYKQVHEDMVEETTTTTIYD